MSSPGAGMSKDLGNISAKMMKAFLPSQMTMGSQLNSLLNTGSPVGSMIPIISNAVEQSRSAASRSMRGTEENLARQGLSGTPFGANIMAGTRLKGEQGTANIATNALMTLMQAFMGAGQQSMQTGTQGMSASASGEQGAKNANSGFMSALSGLMPSSSMSFTKALGG